MTSSIWLLVEWDERNLFASYDVVNYDSLMYPEADLEPGHVVYVRNFNHRRPRRAKIVRISENRQLINERLDLLERQDQQLKRVLHICMEFIHETASLNNTSAHYIPSLTNMARPNVITSSINNFDGRNSLFDFQFNNQTNLYRSTQGLNRSTLSYMQNNRNDSQPVPGLLGTVQNTMQQERGSMRSSTPLPASNARLRQNVPLYFDQGTQTEQTYFQTSVEQIRELESMVRILFRQFQNLISDTNSDHQLINCITVSEVDDNDNVSSIETNEYSTEQNNTDEEPGDADINNGVHAVGVGQAMEENNVSQPMNNSIVQAEDLRKPNSLRVRRVSAQTTNNIETLRTQDSDMVAIGNGYAKVPIRLLNDIDWNSYTLATRQLLQAIFPRSVLANHCLSGKTSSAFMNRPAKKILDPKLVEDIVKIVSTRCQVPRNLVRNSITVKCTDEAKLYRNRQQYKQHRKSVQLKNDENIPPWTFSSDESS